MKTLRRDGITYTVALEPEDIPVRGNAMASGDAEVDRAAEDEILAQLRKGNVAAWCCALVTATVEVDGETFVGRNSLGCCSHNSEAEAERVMLEEYDLPSEARDDLLARLNTASSRGAKAAALILKLQGKV